MKTLPTALAAHYTLPSTTLAYGLVFWRAADNTYLGFTSADQDVSIAVPNWTTILLKSDPGAEVTSIVSSAGPEVGNLEITTLDDETVFKKKDIFGGLWRLTEYQIFRYNFMSPTDGIEVLSTGTLGEIRTAQNKLVIEMRDLRQYLQQDIGSVSQKTCRYRFGDDKCRMDITEPPLLTNCTVTNVPDSTRVFKSSSCTQESDYFGEGIVKFLTGLNAGMSFKVKYFDNTQFILMLFTFAPIAVGDTFEATAGCRKRFWDDCKSKFNNELNFGGEPHRRGVNNLTAAP